MGKVRFETCKIATVFARHVTEIDWTLITARTRGPERVPYRLAVIEDTGALFYVPEIRKSVGDDFMELQKVMSEAGFSPAMARIFFEASRQGIKLIRFDCDWGDAEGLPYLWD